MAVTYVGSGVGGAIQSPPDQWTPTQGQQVHADLVALDAAVTTLQSADTAMDARVDVLEAQAPMLLVSAAFTDAQIKASPTTPLQIKAAPGSGFIWEPIWARAVLRSAGGAYTNIDADCYLTIGHDTAPYELMSYLPNDSSSTPGITYGSASRVSDFLGSTGTKRVVFLPHQDTEGLNNWGLVSKVNDHLGGENKALQVQVNNGGSGNFTGGDGTNTLTVVCLCMKVAI